VDGRICGDNKRNAEQQRSQIQNRRQACSNGAIPFWSCNRPPFYDRRRRSNLAWAVHAPKVIYPTPRSLLFIRRTFTSRIQIRLDRKVKAPLDTTMRNYCRKNPQAYQVGSSVFLLPSGFSVKFSFWKVSSSFPETSSRMSSYAFMNLRPFSVIV
jgi:hypothetical protein